MLGDITRGVGFDEEVKVAWLMVARDRGVAADNFFGCAIGLGKRCGD